MSVTKPRILIAGIGNVFMGDDGFGVAVAELLRGRSWPEHVTLMDAGIRGIDLTYALMDGYDAAILVDTMARGAAPGTLYVLEPDVPAEVPLFDGPSLLDTHEMDPARVLAFLRASGAKLGCLRVVGCEPCSFGSFDEPQLELSAQVRAALAGAVELVEGLVAQLTLRGVDGAEIGEQVGAHEHA